MRYAKGANNESMANINRALIIQYLLKNGVATRAEISKAIELTGASITKIIASLIESGLVNETSFEDDVKRGNRAVGISLNPERYKVIGAKVSRRSFSVGVFDISGKQYDRVSQAVHASDTLEQVASSIRGEIDRYLVDFPEVIAIGVAVPGPYNRRTGEVLLMTEMDNWQNIPLKQEFVGRYNIPVYVEHDANACALADWWFDNLSSVRGTMVNFLVGEGVGAGVIGGGALLSGSNGIAGEIGHISINFNGEQCACGNYGCLERYCSSLAFVKRAYIQLNRHKGSSLHLMQPLTAGKIFEAANAGDSLALQLVEDVAAYIAYGVVTLVNAYDPSVIVISNEMAEGGELMLEHIKKIAKERLLPCLYDNLTIICSRFNHDPILYGAAAVATDRFVRWPSDFLK